MIVYRLRAACDHLEARVPQRLCHVFVLKAHTHTHSLVKPTNIRHYVGSAALAFNQMSRW